MKITKELLKKLVREAVEDEMGSEGESAKASKKLSKQAVKHLEYDHINVDYDTYKDAAPGHVIEMVRDGDPVPKSFIASVEPPEDFESDEDAYRHGELGVYEFWVGTYDGDQKTFSKTGESLDGYFVVEYHGTGWRYVDGPFSSEGEAKQKGVDIANKRGMTTYDEIDSREEGSKEEDEGMLKESVKRRFARLANIRLNEGMEEAPKEEPLEASYPVDYGFGTNKRGIWLTVDDGGKLFVQFGGRIPAEKFFGKDLKPQDFQLKNDGDQHQISDNPMFRPSGDPLKSAQEERYRVLKKGKK